MNFRRFAIGQQVQFYTGSGWKSGSIVSTSDASCLISWSTGATHKLTSVYDDRNVRSRSETPRRGKRGGDTPDAPLPRPEDRAIRDGDKHGTIYWDGAMYFGRKLLKWRASSG